MLEYKYDQSSFVPRSMYGCDINLNQYMYLIGHDDGCEASGILLIRWSTKCNHRSSITITT